MFKYTHIDEYIGSNDSSDFFPWVSLIVAVLAILSSIYIVYLTKRKEIKYDKFKRLCLDFIDSKLNIIANDITNSVNPPSIFTISNHFSDLNLIFIQIRTIYPKLNVDELQNLTFEFTDSIYSNPSIISSHYTKFLITRIKICAKVFDYALYHDLNWCQKILLKK